MGVCHTTLSGQAVWVYGGVSKENLLGGDVPFYRDIDPTTPEGLRAIEGLLRLRKLMDDPQIPLRDLEGTLLLATWNIREFDDASFGQRLPESYHYIAEIISRFDLVAVQEVRPNVAALDRLVGLLGPYWKYLVSDVTKGQRGNRERIAFLYDSRKLRLGGIAGEIVLPPVKGRAVDQVSRTPYVVGFKAGWTKLLLGAVHILWGSGDADNPDRIAEIDNVARELAKEATSPLAWTRTVVLLGDFNIFDPDDAAMRALTRHGFVVPQPLIDERTNLGRNRSYDQIAFHDDDNRLEFTGHAGSVAFFDAVFTDEQSAVFAPGLRKADGTVPADPDSYYKRWRTYQMSDHLPMWIQLKIDYSKEFLHRKYQTGTGEGWVEPSRPSDAEPHR